MSLASSVPLLPHLPAPDSTLAQAAPEFASLRVLLVHEWIYTWAGGERVLEHLAQLIPHADVLSGIVTPEMRKEKALAARAKESWVGRLPGSRRHHRWFLPVHALAFARYDTRDYDLVISVSHAFEKAIRPMKPGGVHVSYCLTPPRYLWDLSVAHDRLASPLQRAALRTVRMPLRALDRRFASRVDHFVSLSHYIADRVRRAYGRESAVVYPPVSLKSAVPAGRREGFLFTMGRLVAYKRVDLAIQAARQLGVRLVVAGDGPERSRLERMAGPEVEFLGRISEERAGALLSTCAAFVFCAEEDFGIAPLEANAHGAPVVAFGAGAALETTQDGVSGVLFQEQTPASVAEGIRRCLNMSWDSSRIRANAERFSPRRFHEGMRAQLVAALERRSA